MQTGKKMGKKNVDNNGTNIHSYDSCAKLQRFLLWEPNGGQIFGAATFGVCVSGIVIQ